MGQGSGFQLVVVAVDEYADFEPLLSSVSAAALEEQLRGWGVTQVRHIEPTLAPAIRAALQEWASDAGAPASSFVYWAGHGWHDGRDQWLCTSETRRPANDSDAIPAAAFAKLLIADGRRRELSGDPDAWTVLVLDCCAATLAVVNIELELLQRHAQLPERYVLFPVADEGGSFAGRFVEKLREALHVLTPNDQRVALRELLGAVKDRLGGDVPVRGPMLSGSITLTNARATDEVLTLGLDALHELRRVIAELPVAVRSHFLHKAQGGESGELAWYFSGRRHPSLSVRWPGCTPQCPACWSSRASLARASPPSSATS